MATGDARYIEQGMRPIAETYRDKFFNPDGSLILDRDIFTGKDISEKLSGDNSMHKYNDDFGNAMLQTAAEIFGDESYRDTARRLRPLARRPSGRRRRLRRWRRALGRPGVADVLQRPGRALPGRKTARRP